MHKNKILIILLLFIFFIIPYSAFALEMPSGNELAADAGISAQSYIVTNALTGQVLIQKNPDMQWVPASLTKLVTLLVVLDTKPDLNKTVIMTAADQTAGGCSDGGACIYTVPGVGFTVDGLFHAALLPSANNAANALAMSTGFTPAQFADKMNAKAAALGATNTHFNEPTGMDPNNKITASDYSKIVTAAFSNAYLQQTAQLPTFLLNSTNNPKYDQTIKNSDKLLSSNDFQIIGAKTGYLDEAKYNFAALLKNPEGREISIVVLGEDHLYTAFDETQTLAALARNVAPNPIIETSAQTGTVSLNQNVNYKGTVYYVDGQSRHPYTSAGAFLSYSFNSWPGVRPASAADIALPLSTSFLTPRNGSLINDHGTIYIITNGERAGFASEDVFKNLGYSYSNAAAGDTSFMITLPPIASASAIHPNGTAVNIDGTIYLIDNGKKIGIPNMQVFNSWGFKMNEAVTANSYDRQAPSGAVLNARTADQLPSANLQS